MLSNGTHVELNWTEQVDPVTRRFIGRARQRTSYCLVASAKLGRLALG